MARFSQFILGVVAYALWLGLVAILILGIFKAVWGKDAGSEP